jgi:hypothetical protein
VGLTSLSVTSLSQTEQGDILARTNASYPPVGLLVEEFDIWREGYQDALVNVYYANTTTLVPCFSDPLLTIATPNPIHLINRKDSNDVSYGRFPSHVYVPFGYELEIQGEHQTGVHYMPLTSLSGRDASDAIVTVEGGKIARKLRARFSDVLWVGDYGEIGDSAATNTATMQAALSQLAAQGGGIAYLPAGSIPFLTLAIPEKCVLAGKGRLVTTLFTEVSANVVTLTGNDCGLSGLTVDGLSLKSGGVGVSSIAKDGVVMNDVLVRRFDTGVLMKGGSYHDYTAFSIEDCNKGYRGIGDNNVVSSPVGSSFIGLGWKGGAITSCIEVGLELLVRDAEVRNIQIEQLRFADHVGDAALLISGAQNITGWELIFERNLVNVKIEDNQDTSLNIPRTTSNVVFSGGYISGGKSTFDGACQNVTFEQVTLKSTELEMNVPDNQVLLRDCIENDAKFSGEATKVSRFNTSNQGTIKGATTSASPVVVFQYRLFPNEVAFFEVTATAEQRNGTGFAVWKKHHAGKGGVATLKHDGVVVAFTAGREIAGQSSGAKAVILSISGDTLSLAAVSGTFVNNELIKEATGAGEARVNGVITLASASLIDTETVAHVKGSNGGAPPAGWNVSYQVSGEELQVFVQGAANQDVAWNVQVGVTVL